MVTVRHNYLERVVNLTSFICRADPKSEAAKHFADGKHSIIDLVCHGIDLIIPGRQGDKL